MRLLRFVVGLIALGALILTPLAPVTWADNVAQAQAADPPGRVGRLNYMSGPVSFAPGGVNQWAAAVLNYPLTTGTALWADENARAEFRVGSTAIRMDQFTEVDILNLDDQTIQLRVPQGTIDIGLWQLDAGERFEVGTPSAAVTLVRPGHYRLDVDQSGQSVRITVRSGQADVSTSRGAFAVRAGQTVVVSDGSASPYEVVPAAALDEFGRWALARQQQEAQALQMTSPYVPATMTGFEDLAYHGTWHRVSGYGHVWYPPVRSDWAPYRHGRWMYIAPWGWTWVDAAPWGFAPFHYGRWAFIGGRWGWVPGVFTIRPIYAPALVVFIILVGGGIGWFPLAPQEVYVPPYQTGPTYFRNINITIVNVTIVNVTRVKYVHRHSPRALTVVRHEAFRDSARVDTSPMAVPRSAITNATVTAAAPAQATLPSVLGHSGLGAAHRPPAVVQERAVVVKSAPPTPAVPPGLGQQVPGRAAPVRPVFDQPRATPPPGPQPKPTERVIVAPTPVAPTPVAPQGGVPTPRPRPTVQPDQPQPTLRPTPQPSATSDDRGRGRGRDVSPTPNCDPRSRDYDPSRCPKPTPTRTKGR
jgi:hypothetical protein